MKKTRGGRIIGAGELAALGLRRTARARWAGKLNRLSASFGWPFRGRWAGRWAAGFVAVLLLPVGFVPLLGYAVACTRAAERGAEEPPPLRPVGRLLADGLALAVAIAVVSVPFVIVAFVIAPLLSNPDVWHSVGLLLHVEGWAVAILIVALPWGVALLLVMPHATARFAASGRATELFDFAAAIRGVRSDFATWNLAVAATVTAWAIGVACTALFCVGLVPGTFYAILVSAHACASLGPTRPDPPTG